jgi:glycogen(starch) synthase
VRVLFVSQEFPPDTGWGGIGTYVHAVSQALAASGIEVHVLSLAEGQGQRTGQVGDVTVHRFPLPPVWGAGRLPETAVRMGLASAVARTVGRLRPAPTVIECPDWRAEGLVLGLRQRWPLVVRLHSSARQLFPYTRQGRAMRGADGWGAVRLEEAAVRRANLVLSTRSNLVQNQGWMGLKESGVRVIPHIVRLPSPVAFPEPSEPLRVTFVGRMEPRKAPDVVLAAAPKVLEAVPTARFVFVGRDVGDPGARPSSSWMRREAERLGVAHAVELRGELDWSAVAEELSRATVCVFPSRWECFPNVTAEASAIGRPVVVSGFPAFREMVEDQVTGLVAASENAEAWATAIRDLLINRSRAQALGEAGSRLIRRVSDPGRLTDLTIAAYEDAVERWKRGQRAGGRRSLRTFAGRSREA